MKQINEIVKWETKFGAPISVGNTIITPRSQALSLILPFGGFVWNRPLSVKVERNGQSEEIPILDVTRSSLFALTAAGFAMTIFALMWRIGRKQA